MRVTSIYHTFSRVDKLFRKATVRVFVYLSVCLSARNKEHSSTKLVSLKFYTLEFSKICRKYSTLLKIGQNTGISYEDLHIYILISRHLRVKYQIYDKTREAEERVINLNITARHKNTGKPGKKSPKDFGVTLYINFMYCCGIHKLFLHF